MIVPWVLLSVCGKQVHNYICYEVLGRGTERTNMPQQDLSPSLSPSSFSARLVYVYTSNSLATWKLLSLNTKSTESGYLEQNPSHLPATPRNKLLFKHPSHWPGVTPSAHSLLVPHTHSVSSPPSPVIKSLCAHCSARACRMSWAF